MPSKNRTQKEWRETLPPETQAVLERHDVACHIMQRDVTTEDERYELLLAVIAPKSPQLQEMAA